MKHYEVHTIPSVHRSIMEYYKIINANSPGNALGWLRGIYEAIKSLKTMPTRCGCIREQSAFDEEFREILHHSHRIIFTVDEENAIVEVLDLRHAAQDDWKAGVL